MPPEVVASGAFVDQSRVSSAEESFKARCRAVDAQGHEGPWSEALEWDATGPRLASGGEDGQVCVWNVADGSPVRAPLLHENGTPEQPVTVAVRHVAFSPDGRLLASVSESKPDLSGFGTVRVWDLGSGAEVFRFPAQSGSVSVLTWTGDVRYLLAMRGHTTWQRWDSTTRELSQVDFGEGRVAGGRRAQSGRESRCARA